MTPDGWHFPPPYEFARGCALVDAVLLSVAGLLWGTWRRVWG